MHASETVLESVTVYRRGARVVRRVGLTGTSELLRLEGLPLVLDDSSVRVRVQGTGVCATDVRVGVAVAPQSAALLPPRDEELRAARRATAVLRSEERRLLQAVERLQAVQILARPTPARGDRPLATPTQARRDLARLRREEHERLTNELLDCQNRLRAAQEHLSILEDRATRASSARNPQEHELSKCLTVTLEGTPASDTALLIEYLVPGACWSPGYALWLEGGRARLALRALVAQRTGENWTGARLKLSTADPERFVELPELSRLRIGRAQPGLRKKGWRAPPAGVKALFADYDRAFGIPVAAPSSPVRQPPLPAPPPPSAAPPRGSALGALSVPLPAPRSAAPLPAPGQAPELRRVAVKKKEAVQPSAAPYAEDLCTVSSVVLSKTESVAAAAPGPRTAPAVAPAPLPSLDLETMAYGRLRLYGPDRLERGELASLALAEFYADDGTITVNIQVAIQAAITLSKIAPDLPPGHHYADRTDSYDYAYPSCVEVDIPSDGCFHAVPIDEYEAAARLRYVTVPREASDVFRLLEVTSPIDSALLPGPVDVYEKRPGQSESTWLLTASVPAVPPRGDLEIGLGVEQRISLARNVTFAEQSKGLLGGGLALVHNIAIDLSNGLQQAAQIEVRERVPTKREGDEDVEIDIGPADPKWEVWDQDQSLEGGYRWFVSLEPGEKRTLKARYSIKLSSKNQLAGGNRREA